MDFFKKNRYKLLNIVKVFVLFVFMFGVGLSNVRATTKYVKIPDGTYRSFRIKTYKNKQLCNKDGKSCKIAYCTQLHKNIHNGKKYSTSTSWNIISKKSFIVAQIIEIGKKEWKNASDTYGRIQYALNCYLKLDSRSCKSLKSSKYKSTDEVMKAAEDVVKTYKFQEGKTTQTLPSIKINASSNVLHRWTDNKPEKNDQYRYLSDAINIGGMLDSYGGNNVTYKYSLEQSEGKAFLCTKKEINTDNCKTSGTLKKGQKYYLYFRVTCEKSKCKKGNVKLKIQGSNTSEYPVALRWKYNSDNQVLVTEEGNETIKRSIEVTKSFTYPKGYHEDVPEYLASLEKTDEYGNSLPGGDLSLFIASKGNAKDEDYDNYKKLETLCTINSSKGESECSKDDIKNQKLEGNLLKPLEGANYVDGNYLCYSETKVPDGYKKIGTFCSKISIKADEDDKTYYKYVTEENDDSEETGQYSEIEETEYNKYFTGKKACVKKTVAEANTTDISEDDIKKAVSQLVTSSEIKSDNVSNDDGSTLSMTQDSCEGGDTEAGASNTEKKKSICVYSSDQKTYSYDMDTNNEYCSGVVLASVTPSTGNYAISVVNNLNVVKISKRNITGEEELEGANLEIYTTKDGECTDTLATSKNFEYAPYAEKEIVYEDEDKNVDDDSSVDEGDTSTDEEDTSTDTESDSGESEQGDEQDSGDEVIQDGYGFPATDDSGNYILKWSSGLGQSEIYGIKAGTYCLVEKNPPGGYIKSNKVTKFSVDDAGAVSLVKGSEGDAEIDKDGAIILKDNLTKMSISKQDMATSEELPGAEMSICYASEENNGEMLKDMENDDCLPATLADGSSATWTSGTEPHEVEGLPAGTYYLVEKVAPEGYDTAESILFKMTEDGVVTDKDGNSLADNKLVMHDKTLEQTKTGDVIFGVGLVLLIGVIGIGVYYYKNKMNAGLVTNSKNNANVNKIKSRKIHK